MLQILAGFVTSRLGSALGVVVLIILLFAIRALVFPSAPLWIFTTIAILIIVGWIMWQIWKRRQDKKKDKEIADGIAASAQRAEDNARPDKREEIVAMRQRMERIIQKLQSLQPHGKRGTALYNLPWLLVVGPPGDGKTTALLSLRHTGVKYVLDPQLDEIGGAKPEDFVVKGTGGTRSCNWFFSKDAIIIDTAGRWEDRDKGIADEREWLQFLKLVQTQRPKRPINGVIVFCKIARILESPAESQRRAKIIRDQIEETMLHLGVHVPVYLIFSKCDLIPGFVEFFQDLSPERRKQIWGITRRYQPQMVKGRDSLVSEQEAILGDLDNGLELLFRTLEQRRRFRLDAPELLHGERTALSLYPSQFRQIYGPVREFISNLLEERLDGRNPVLRGIYFTSATQHEGMPILQLMKEVAGAYNIPEDALPTSSRHTFDSYFLHDLMTEVVFKDLHFGGRFRKSLFNKTQKLVAWALGVTAALIAVWMLTSYFVNSSTNSSLRNLAGRVESTAAKADAVKALAMLDSLRVGLEEYRSPSFPFGLFYWAFGRGMDGELTKAVEPCFAKKMKEAFVDEAWKSSESKLQRYVSDPLDFLATYKTYIFLSDPPGVKRVEPDAVASYIMSTRFADETDKVARDRYEKTLKNLLAYYTEAEGRVPYTANPRLLGTAKNNLKTGWRWETILNNLAEEMSPRESDFSAAGYSPVVGARALQFAYTSNGLSGGMSEAMDATFQRLQSDSIAIDILGDGITKEADNPLQRIYTVQCPQEWNSFFEGLGYSSEAVQSAEFFSEIGRSKSNLKSILEDIANATSFEDRRLQQAFKGIHDFTGIPFPTSVGDKVLDAAGSGSSKAPKKPSIDDYITALKDLGGPVTKVKMAANGCAAAYADAKAAMAGAGSGVDLSDLAGSPLHEFAKKPLDMAQRNAGGACAQCLNQVWAKSVYEEYRTFSDKYPFVSLTREAQDASFDGVKAFLAADGPLMKFYGEEIAPAQGVIGGIDAYKNKFDAARRLSSQLGASSVSIDLQFDASTLPAGQLRSLQVSTGNGILFEYANGPAERCRLPVPCLSDPITVRLDLNSGEYATAEFSGPWASLRLLESATLSGGVVQLPLRSGGREYLVQSRLTSQSGSEPLPQLFRRLNFPERICQ